MPLVGVLLQHNLGVCTHFATLGVLIQAKSHTGGE